MVFWLHQRRLVAIPLSRPGQSQRLHLRTERAHDVAIPPARPGQFQLQQAHRFGTEIMCPSQSPSTRRNPTALPWSLPTPSGMPSPRGRPIPCRNPTVPTWSITTGHAYVNTGFTGELSQSHRHFLVGFDSAFWTPPSSASLSRRNPTVPPWSIPTAMGVGASGEPRLRVAIPPSRPGHNRGNG